MKLKKYGFFLASLGLLASCANENIDGPNTPEQADGEVYLTLNLSQVGTRADGDNGTPTGEAGTLPGTSEESKISNVLIVITDANDESKITKYASTVSGNTVSFTLTGNDFLALQALPTAHVYAVCNLGSGDYPEPTGCSNAMQRVMSLSNDDNTYWTNDYFLMSNAEANEVTIDVVKVKNGEFTSTSPLSLGTVKVQRTMARLDVSKGQPTVELPTGNDNISLTLDGLTLVNKSKNFFLYKEVGSGSSFSLFAAEMYDGNNENDATKTNYVNDPKASVTTYTTDHLFNLATSQTAAQQTYVTDWFGSDANSSSITYDIWNYVNPNTVIDKDQQVNGKSTGIIFRAKFTGTGLSGLLTAGDGNNLYVYRNKVYGDLAKLKATLATPATQDDQALKAIYESLTSEISDKTAEADIISALLEDKDFQIFPADEAGKGKDASFHCYYYYWIRHNGVGSNVDGVMHPMEFGVVRNNVYKLAVTKLSGFGKPGNYTPNGIDPDDPPHTPETAENATIKVALEVLPWGVRTDNIEF